ncbi:hypothetical protein D3C76_923370 [compost metagenome]
MILAQGFSQDAEQRSQPGAGRHQPQRSVVPVRVVMQGSATQFAETDRVTNLQLTRGITEFAGLATIKVKLQKTVFFRQAGQGIRPCDVARPQHQMLPGAVAQRALWRQAQAQNATAQPIGRSDLGRTAVLLRVEGVHLQIFNHLALAGQAPALLTLLYAQCVGAAVAGQSLHALHQAGMTTAGAAAVGYRHAVLIQGIKQIGAGCHRPLAIAHA